MEVGMTIPITRFRAIGASSACVTSPGRPRRGSVLSSWSLPGTCWGIPVADDIVLVRKDTNLLRKWFL